MQAITSFAQIAWNQLSDACGNYFHRTKQNNNFISASSALAHESNCETLIWLHENQITWSQFSACNALLSHISEYEKI